MFATSFRRIWVFAAVAVVAAMVLAATASQPVASGPAAPAASAGQPRVAVTTSWLECALRDVAGDRFAVTRLCPPGSCPGHFDVTPGAARELGASSFVLMFDFQSGMAGRLRGLSGADGGAPAMLTMTGPKSMCTPDNYGSVCRDLADALVRDGHLARPDADRAVSAVEARLAALSTELRDAVTSAGLAGVPVVASHHQEGFCRWLGLDPVATFASGELNSPAALAAVVEKGRSGGARLVVGNLQEGRQAADALARQLGVPVVVFSNFPALTPDEPTYDALLRRNLDALLSAVPPRP